MTQRFMFDAAASRRERDENGFLIVRNNPVAKAGIYEYLGGEIGADEAARRYKVFRPFSELTKAMADYSGKPILLEHEWVNPEDVPAVRGAVMGAVRAEEPYLYADIIIYDAEAADAIENGSYKELSPGYLSDYEKKSGVYNGEHYDYIQKNIRFNHLALVKEGRTGKDLRVLDEDFKEADHKRDESGKFTSGGNTGTNGKENGKNTGQKAAGITITGKELGDFQTNKEWRQAARAYYSEHLQGKSANHPQLGQIEFSGKGIKEAISHSGNIQKLKLIPYLREIIETGTAGQWQGLKHPRTDGLVQFCDIKNTVNLNGKKEDVRVVIGKHADGRLFYDLFLNNPNIQQQTQKTQDKTPAEATRSKIRDPSGLATVADSFITEPAYKINIFFTDV